MRTNKTNPLLAYRDRRTHKLEKKEEIKKSEVQLQKVAHLYVRVSTDEQADRGFSQRDQDERLHLYCEKNNLKVGKVIYEDYSAKTFNRRPAWTKLLTEVKRSKGKECDLILFTKWDRFSRNTANAYNMIDTLLAFGIEPNAIDQHLDLSVPESRILLSVYISMAEVENIRRGLNVVVGMRKARKEGKWMGRAPVGYTNKIREDKSKYIDIDEPEASHIKWGFETIAEGIYDTENVWKLGRSRGMKCSRNTFWAALRNPVYCGKIIIPPNEDNEISLVDGIHRSLISEDLFWDVQDILNGKKKRQSVKVVSPENLPLRGFLYCPECNRTLTGSASKGRPGYYYYYHCKWPCRVRFNADDINKEFEGELRRFIPKPGRAEVFRQIILDVSGKSTYEADRNKIIANISEQQNQLTRLRALLLKEDIDIADYKIMKRGCEEKLLRLEAELKRIKTEATNVLDLEAIVAQALEKLKNIDKLYKSADIEGKRHIIGSIYPEKWSIKENKDRTDKVNLAALLIYQINNGLGHKKAGVRSKIRTYSGKVPGAGVEPARFPTGV